MDERRDGSLTLACVADGSAGGATLHESLVALFPEATVTRIDTAVERSLPPEVNCAVIDATVRGKQGVDVLRRFRAGGYAGAAVLVIDEAHPDASANVASAARVGARSCGLTGDYLGRLGAAVADALRVQDGGEDGAPSTHAANALRQAQQTLAVGALAIDLRHALNNPLAALLAEAQLLEFEPLAPDHKAAVGRIIDLTRRVIGVVRELDGVGRV